MKKLLKYFYTIIAIAILFLPIQSIADDNSQCVILLHGLARTHRTMTSLEKTLKKYHYVVINKDYPSTKKSIEVLANEIIEPLMNECLKNNVQQIHFVTHSMGGIVLQKYLEKHAIQHLGHIIMLGPPNHGSPVSDLLLHNWLYYFITGPAGQELTTVKTSTPNSIRLNGDYSIGVIAGTFNFIPFGNYIFHEPNDGAVAVSSTKTNIMKDFMAFPVSHPFIMDDPMVQYEILNFLKFGKFQKISYVK